MRSMQTKGKFRTRILFVIVMQRTTEQAASAEEASSSVEEMHATIKQNADNAMMTEKIALMSAADAEQSGKAVAEAVAAMKNIAGKISIIVRAIRGVRWPLQPRGP